MYSGGTMQTNRDLPGDAALTSCTWCGAALDQIAKPAHVAAVFCSQHCEIQANFWLDQEMRLIEITHRLSPEDLFDGLQDECDMPEDQYNF
jgi:endogenous inhibitor of DNA gyrase (YacG/DUF329 family)